MLEVKGIVSVKKGSGIFYNGSSINSDSILDIDCDTMNNHSIGPFELIKAREVIETSIVEFAATQIKLQELIRPLSTFVSVEINRLCAIRQILVAYAHRFIVTSHVTLLFILLIVILRDLLLTVQRYEK